MILTKYPKSTSQQFGYAIVTPSDFSSSTKYPIIIVGSDSTKVGDGSLAKLDLVANWAGYNEFKAATDVFKFVILFIQTIHEYEYGELQFAVNVAKSLQYATATNIHFYGYDIGAMAFAREAGSDPVFAASFATVKLDAQSCGATASSSQNIADARTPVWVSHAFDDTVFPYTCSSNFASAVSTKGGISFYTQYITAGHNIPNRTLTAYGQAPNTWLPATPIGNYAATGYNNPKMSWYQWFMSNRRGAPFVSPSATYVPPTTTTKTLVATVRVYDDGSIEKVIT